MAFPNRRLRLRMNTATSLRTSSRPSSRVPGCAGCSVGPKGPEPETLSLYGVGPAPLLKVQRDGKDDVLAGIRALAGLPSNQIPLSVGTGDPHGGRIPVFTPWAPSPSPHPTTPSDETATADTRALGPAPCPRWHLIKTKKPELRTSQASSRWAHKETPIRLNHQPTQLPPQAAMCHLPSDGYGLQQRAQLRITLHGVSEPARTSGPRPLAPKWGAHPGCRAPVTAPVAA